MRRRMFSLMAAVCLSLIACSKDDDNANNNPGAVTTGTWRVTLFTDSGKDETSDFSGYTFTFNSNGGAVAAKGGTSKNGTWSQNSRFNIDFGAKSDANKPLGELTDDWVIISQSNTEIKLKDDNDDSGELLTFTKN